MSNRSARNQIFDLSLRSEFSLTDFRVRQKPSPAFSHSRARGNDTSNRLNRRIRARFSQKNEFTRFVAGFFGEFAPRRRLGSSPASIIPPGNFQRDLFGSLPVLFD
jgi:hypothetical protein